MVELDKAEIQTINKSQTKQVKVISITGGKGGIGKTNIAINLAMALAKQNLNTVLFDADLGLANIDVLLGIKAQRNIYHVLNGECHIDDIVVKGPGGIKIIPATSGMQRMADLSITEQASIIHAFSNLSDDIDVLLIDTAAGISQHVVNFSHACQEIIVVVCNEATSIADAYALIKLLNKEHGIKKFRILANMTRYTNEGREIYIKLKRVADKFLQVNLLFLGSVSYDEHIRLAAKKHQAVIERFPGAKSSIDIKKLALEIAKWKLPNDIDGRIAFFFERMLQHNSAKGLVE